MLRYMDQIKTFNDNLSCREVKINKKNLGDLLYFALKCDKFFFYKYSDNKPSIHMKHIAYFLA